MNKYYIFIIVLCIFSIGLIITGFIIAGSPISQKNIQLDKARLNDFQQIQYAINSYYQKNESLPESLTKLKENNNNLNTQDPETHTEYTYEIMSSGEYKLCTTFGLDSKDEQDYNYNYLDQLNKHKKGYDCITIATDKIKSAEVNHKTETYLLPQDFKVYVRNNTVINHPAPGFEEQILPTYNYYTGKDGGYVAVYSYQKEGAVYSVGDGIYVVGQVRFKGKYINRIFYPDGYQEGADITKDPKIIEICNNYFPNFANKIWVGGDTGGWYGIQEDGSLR